MKQRLCALLLAGSVVCALTGCGSIFEDEYTWSAPYVYNVGGESGDAMEIGNYNMLKSALLDLINRHEEHAVFRFSRYNGSVADDLAAAGLEIRTENPMGAYAVESIGFDTSRIVSYYTADVSIRYKRTAEEIRGVVGISSITELGNRLRETVTDYGDGIVLRIYSPQVNEDSLAEMVDALHFSDPVSVVTEPVTEIAAYPGEGANRIYEIRLDYGASAPLLRSMSRQLTTRIWELSETLSAPSAPELALACAETLNELLSSGSGIGAYGGTAYGALIERSADSKGTALGYKALCDAAGIECMVVRGNIGSMGAEEHFWNIIGLEEEYYHVDVSAFGDAPENAFLLDDESLWGTYLWDAEAYPACTGGLRWSDVAPEAPPEETPPPEETVSETPPEETDAPAGTDAPEETEPPAETEAPPEETDAPQETEVPAEEEPPPAEDTQN